MMQTSFRYDFNVEAFKAAKINIGEYYRIRKKSLRLFLYYFNILEIFFTPLSRRMIFY